MPAQLTTPLPLKALTNLLAVARREGLSQALDALRHRAWERFYEWRLGVETTGGLDGRQLGFTDPACHNYEATDYVTLFRLLGGLPWERGREMFIDFGCGKGRVPLVAAMQPVRRVVGVELSADLSAMARSNIHRARRHLRCRDIEIVTCGADAYRIPAGPLTIFFWNPFAGEILARVMANIRDSHRAQPRHIRIVAVYPLGSEFEQQLDAQDWLQVQATGPVRGSVAYRVAEAVEG